MAEPPDLNLSPETNTACFEKVPGYVILTIFKAISDSVFSSIAGSVDKVGITKNAQLRKVIQNRNRRMAARTLSLQKGAQQRQLTDAPPELFNPELLQPIVDDLAALEVDETVKSLVGFDPDLIIYGAFIMVLVVLLGSWHFGRYKLKGSGAPGSAPGSASGGALLALDQIALALQWFIIIMHE